MKPTRTEIVVKDGLDRHFLLTRRIHTRSVAEANRVANVEASFARIGVVSPIDEFRKGKMVIEFDNPNQLEKGRVFYNGSFVCFFSDVEIDCNVYPKSSAEGNQSGSNYPSEFVASLSCILAHVQRSFDFATGAIDLALKCVLDLGYFVEDLIDSGALEEEDPLPFTDFDELNFEVGFRSDLQYLIPKYGLYGIARPR